MKRHELQKAARQRTLAAAPKRASKPKPIKFRGGDLSSMLQSVKNVGTKALDLGKKVLYGTKDVPPKVLKCLEEVGDATILGATIGRTPVQAFITGIIKLVSSTPYDKLFHLFIVLDTTKGKVILEKNERLNMERKGLPAGSQTMPVTVPAGLTVGELFANTQKLMGENFTPYSAAYNNCQNFIVSVLKANRMDTPELVAFVKQDTTSIFKDPWFRKFAHTVTDVAGRANIAVQGGDLRSLERSQPSMAQREAKLSANYVSPKMVGGMVGSGSNEMTNSDIDLFLDHLPGYMGCFIKTEFKGFPAGDHYAVINLNGQSHWCGLCRKDGLTMWFDSYGFPAPVEIEKKIGHYTWSDLDIQDLFSSACGFYTIAFLLAISRGESYEHWMERFGEDTELNERILSELVPKGRGLKKLKL